MSETIGYRQFAMQVLAAIERNTGATTATLRDADAARFHSYINGYEQAASDIRRLILEKMTAATTPTVPGLDTE